MIGRRYCSALAKSAHYKGEIKQKCAITNASNAHLPLHGKGDTPAFVAKRRRTPSKDRLPLVA
jgi:hypothetical protein